MGEFVILPPGVEFVAQVAIEPGDVVRLKSGGPEMTVVKVYRPDEEGKLPWAALTFWNEGRSQFCKEEIALRLLVKNVAQSSVEEQAAYWRAATGCCEKEEA